MKPLCIILSLFFYLPCTGQNQLKIEYPFPLDTVIFNIDTIGNEKTYNIDFVNKQGQTIKNRSRFLIENHNSIKGYNIFDEKTYYYYKDSLLSYSLNYIYTLNKVYKTEYNYNHSGKLLTRTEYVYFKSLSGYPLLKFQNEDYFLNHPNEIPIDNWKINTILKKKYNTRQKIIYKGYLRQLNKKNNIELEREDYYAYNNQSQLIEHTSLSRTKRESDLMQTFEYDCNGNMIKRNWFENGKYQGFDNITYTDSIIYCKTFFYNYPSNKPMNNIENPYSGSFSFSASRRYIYDIKTKKYRE